MKKTQLNNASPTPDSLAPSEKEPLVTAEQFAEASTRAEAPRSFAPSRRVGSQAPTPAQQQAHSLARAASRRARIRHAVSKLPHYDIRMAWYKSRLIVVVFLIQFALVAIAVADGLPVVDIFNNAVNTAIHGIRGSLDPLIIALTTLGDVPYMAAICLVTCLILLIFRRWNSLFFFIVNITLAVAFVHVLKLIFAIPRPGAETLVMLPSSYSFPSAHSFVSLIVLGLIGLFVFRALYRKGSSIGSALVPAIILGIIALLIGLSRIYVGVHWPSDVLAGWFLGAAWLSFVSALYLYEPVK